MAQFHHKIQHKLHYICLFRILFHKFSLFSPLHCFIGICCILLRKQRQQNVFFWLQILFGFKLEEIFCGCWPLQNNGTIFDSCFLVFFSSVKKLCEKFFVFFVNTFIWTFPVESFFQKLNPWGKSQTWEKVQN